jgi:hypothetical protein
MIDPPQRLLEPRLLGRVAAHHLRRAIPFSSAPAGSRPR